MPLAEMLEVAFFAGVEGTVAGGGMVCADNEGTGRPADAGTVPDAADNPPSTYVRVTLLRRAKHTMLDLTLKVSDPSNTAVILPHRIIQNKSSPFARGKLRLANEGDDARFGSTNKYTVTNLEGSSGGAWQVLEAPGLQQKENKDV